LRASVEKYAHSQILQSLKQVLVTISGWVDEIPPAEIGLSRFGNPSFRFWHDKVAKELDSLLMNIIINESLRNECRVYLLNSFGDRNRIDYGTGHEANMICFMLSLHVGNLIPESDVEGLVSILFWEYYIILTKVYSSNAKVTIRLLA
jgi:serine/threonine-protein phosphatase 2A activator